MKIIVPNHFPLEGSGSGIYTQNVARELSKLGHQVTVIAPDHTPATSYPFAVETILFKGPDNSDFDVPFNFPCFTTHPKSTTTYYELDDKQISQYVDAFQATTDRIVEALQPDLIHCQHCWVTPYCASKTGVPYLATAHGTDQMGFRKDQRYRARVMQGVEGAARIIAVSSQVRDDVEAVYRLPPDKVTILLNGFNDEIFRPCPIPVAELVTEHGLPADTEMLISFVGKLAEFKGIDVLIDAAAIYQKELPKSTTVIVGFGQLDGALREQAARLGLDRIRFLGHQHQPAVARIYAAASVSVVPSRVEPFGLVAIEAMACGTPVVATNAGGLPDFVNDDVGGLVQMDNPKELAQRIIEEVNNDTKNSKGKTAAKYALDGFSWSGVATKLVQLYDDVLGQA